jgi:hypothetical protein
MLVKFFPAVPMADQAEGFLKDVELGHDPAGHVSREEPQLAIAGTASDVCGSIRACDAKKTGCDLCKLDAIKSGGFCFNLRDGNGVHIGIVVKWL